MTGAPTAGVVVDTMVISWLLRDRPDALTDRYRTLMVTGRCYSRSKRSWSCVTGLRARWGDLRWLRLERRIAELTVVQPDDQMITICAQLRQDCRQIGHALSNKIHDGDRWIAATAIRLGLPLASHDDVFDRIPRLERLTTRPEA